MNANEPSGPLRPRAEVATVDGIRGSSPYRGAEGVVIAGESRWDGTAARRATAGVLVVIAYAVLSAAFAGPAGAQAVNTFSGVLRDRDGNPLAGQQISLQGSPFGAGDQTGSDGSFTIHAAPGTYTLAVFAMGIMPMPGAPPPAAPTFYSVSGPQIDLSNGDVHQDLTLPTLKLDVSVLDPDGAPVAGAGVGLFQQFAAPTPETPPMTTSFINTQFDLYPGGHATGGFSSSAQTDNSGHAHLILFPADNLRVSAQRSGFPPVVEELGSVTQDTSGQPSRTTAPSNRSLWKFS